MVATLLSLVLFLADAPAATADLSGKVVGPDQQPIPGATVYVYGGKPKTGDTPHSQLDYPDCGKTTQSNAEGGFTISGVDASLQFQLLVFADSYRPQYLNRVDPSRGSTTAKLKALPTDIPPERIIKGHVVDAAVAPVVGAKIDPYGAKDGNERWWGSVDKVCEGPAYTDTKGQFMIVLKKPDVPLDLRTTARNCAPQNIALLEPGDVDHEIALASGASLSGRIMKDDKPLEGIRVKLVQQDTGIEKYVGEFTATTDIEGKYTFAHVLSNEEYIIVATMKTLAPYGALPNKQCHVTGDDSTTDAGDLTVEQGHTVSGSIFCSDEKPPAKGTKVHLGRWNGGDTQDATVGEDGKFEFKGVPDELMQFWVDLKGYHVAEINVSFEPANARFLMGKVDGDIDDLKVQMDPGEPPASNYNGNKWKTLENSRLTGVAAEK